MVPTRTFSLTFITFPFPDISTQIMQKTPVTALQTVLQPLFHDFISHRMQYYAFGKKIVLASRFVEIFQPSP